MYSAMSQPYSSFHNEPSLPSYRVVNQRPPQQSHFPISFNFKIAVVFGVFKFTIGFVEFVLGLLNIFAIDFYTSYVAFPIWCGLIVSEYQFSTYGGPFWD